MEDNRGSARLFTTRQTNFSSIRSKSDPAFYMRNIAALVPLKKTDFVDKVNISNGLD